MDVKQIVADYLKANGFDGLFGNYFGCGCGCGLDSLMPCDNPFQHCKPAYKIKCIGSACPSGCVCQDEPGAVCYTTVKPQSDQKDQESCETSQTTTEEITPVCYCPKCGREIDDFDGFGFIGLCPSCGYCNHPNSSLVGEKWICGICGKEVLPPKE